MTRARVQAHQLARGDEERTEEEIVLHAPTFEICQPYGKGNQKELLFTTAPNVARATYR